MTWSPERFALRVVDLVLPDEETLARTRNEAAEAFNRCVETGFKTITVLIHVASIAYDEGQNEHGRDAVTRAYKALQLIRDFVSLSDGLSQEKLRSALRRCDEWERRLLLF